MERTTMKDNKLYFGEFEFTNLIWVLIRAYRFRNSNKNPEAIVLPDIKEIAGVRIEFGGNDEGTAKGTGPTTDKNGG